ncbi:phage tail protein [Psychrobacillus antarcticus]|uniref:phage tail protein n=1 Tax=Psychrobacillus antarcticus TaxID=2879115 RepID=UPI0024077B63|nr:phage tail protein [Psychrobacillus antarcticus]
MLTVTQNNQTEMLNQIQGFEMDEEVNGTLVVKFASFSVLNNPGHILIDERPIFTVDGYDFRLAQLKKNNNRKDVTAASTFYDLVGTRQEAIYGGTHTLNEFASFIFQGTGWTFTNEVPGSRLIPNFGENNVIVLKDALCSAFECEMKIMPNKHVHFAPKIGPDNDAQYRRGHNIKSLAESVDWSKMRTQITGHGANGLVVTYTSPHAGKYGVIVADPITDDEITESSTMLERLKSELVDYPEAYFELDAVELTNKELGERVWLIDEVMGIEYQTRVLSKKTIIRGNKLVTSSVILGTTLPRKNADLLVSQKVEIDENRKEYRSKFTQTNELIHLSVEEVNASIATLELKADNVSISVNNRITQEMAAINVKADNINLSVSNLGTRVSGTESSINIQAGQIQQKVSVYDFNGQTISSLITQDPYAISLMAQNLAFQGLVTVTNLKTPGATIVDGSNVYSSAFVVGRGTGSTLTMTAVAGSHLIQSIDAAGLRIGSNGSMGLSASGAMGVYVPNSNLVAQAGFRVTGGVVDIQVPAYINNASIATENYVGTRIAQLENDIKAWANGKFVAK